MEVNPNEDNLLIKKKIKKQTMFLSEYASVLMGSGVHTSRVIRNTKRIGKALGVDVTILGLQRSLQLSAEDKITGEYYSILKEIPNSPISFEINTNLSQLSWEAIDNNQSFKIIKKRFDFLINKPKLHPLVILILSSFANASFCALFGGDWFSMGVVFSATLIGMYAKQMMLKKKTNQFLVFVMSAFIASLIASTSIIFNTTSEVALATSVLFLIPGVPLINGFMDIMEGHVLIGMARLINAFLLIMCIAIGLSGTIMLIKESLM